MEHEAIVLLQWIFGAMGAVATLLFGVWWKIESRQDKKIDTLAKNNKDAHILLHAKIEATQAELTRQHMSLRDKIEEIWKVVVKHES